MSDETKSTLCDGAGEPRCERATTPIWLVGLLFLLFFVAAWSFDQRGGWFDPRVSPPFTSYAETMKFHPPVPDIDPSILRGKKLYAACAACHQDSGLGSASVGAPPLVDSEWVLASGPNRIIRIALDGLQGPIKVKGQQYGTGIMTPFKMALSDQDIADILSFVRNNPAWKHSAGLVKPEEVKAIRDLTKDRSTPWTEAELLTVPVK